MKRFQIYVTAIVLFTLFAACSKDDGDDLKITSSRNVELISKKTSQIECSDSKAIYSSENEYVADAAEKVQQIAHTAGLQSTSLVWNTAYKGIDDWQLALRQEETKEKAA